VQLVGSYYTDISRYKVNKTLKLRTIVCIGLYTQ